MVVLIVRQKMQKTAAGKKENGRQLLNVFVMRISCLLNSSEIIKYDTYKDVVTPLLIYKCQQNHIAEGNVFILSAFPEFLLDYFSIKFWNSCIKCSKRSVKNCKD